MKFLKGLLASAAVAMLAAQPVAAAPVAQKLSLKNAATNPVRASAAKGKSKFGEEISPIVYVLAAAAIIALVIVVADGGGSDSP